MADVSNAAASMRATGELTHRHLCPRHTRPARTDSHDVFHQKHGTVMYSTTWNQAPKLARKLGAVHRTRRGRIDGYYRRQIHFHQE